MSLMLRDKKLIRSKASIKEIIILRKRLEEIYKISGSNSSKYITAALRLKVMEKEYIEGKISEVTDL